MNQPTFDRGQAIQKYFRLTPVEPTYTVQYILLATASVLFAVALGPTAITWMSNAKEPKVQGSVPIPGEACLVGCLSIPLAGVAMMLLVCGIVWIFSSRSGYRARFLAAEPKLPDEEIEAILSYDLERIKAHARTKFDFARQNRRMLAEFCIGAPSQNSPVRYGFDGVLRAARYDILLVILAEHEICCYQCLLDFHTGAVVNDRDSEFPYDTTVQSVDDNAGITWLVWTDQREVVASRAYLVGTFQIKVPASVRQLGRRERYLTADPEEAVSAIRSKSRLERRTGSQELIRQDQSRML
jgi:hypothetical protein